jgi:hypothetical protein
MKKPLRVYVRTPRCLVGASTMNSRMRAIRFFEEVRQGQFVVVVSDVTLDELELAPKGSAPLAELRPQQVEKDVHRVVGRVAVWDR